MPLLYFLPYHLYPNSLDAHNPQLEIGVGKGGHGGSSSYVKILLSAENLCKRKVRNEVVT